MVGINKKQIIIAFFIVLILFIISITGAYYIKQNYNGSNTQNITASFEDKKVIKLSNKLPISDALGKQIEESDDKQSYVVFTIKNESDSSASYEVFLTKNESKLPIKENYIKFYLTDENNEPLKGFDTSLIPSYNDLTYLSNKPASKLLYKGVISGNSSSKLKLRVWVADTYALSDTTETVSFDIDVREQ